MGVAKSRTQLSDFHGFSSSPVWMWELDHKESWAPKNWCFWTVVLEKTLESLGLQGDQTSQFQKKSVLNIHWKDWCWSWNSNTLTTWCEELTHWKTPWCWERLKAGGEADDRGWNGWMALDRHEFEQLLGVGDGEGSLVCCSPWGCKESDTTEWLNWYHNALYLFNWSSFSSW